MVNWLFVQTYTQKPAGVAITPQYEKEDQCLRLRRINRGWGEMLVWIRRAVTRELQLKVQPTTHRLSTYAYQTGFSVLNFGEAAAIATLMVLPVLTLNLVQLLLQRQRVTFH
jgi:hypothetical protein